MHIHVFAYKQIAYKKNASTRAMAPLELLLICIHATSMSYRQETSKARWLARPHQTLHVSMLGRLGYLLFVHDMGGCHALAWQPHAAKARAGWTA